MTKINKLVMDGFKSFGEKTELVFGNHFNCVLGPNGSGKSNIFDAICFVLGKGSAKGLRAEKSANLIYNGGKSKQPAKQGEVSIYFDNSKKTFPTDDPEVKITRIVKASGQSVYKINDKPRTREEILELLSIAKINPDGYNIVLQGDIVRFIEMSPIDKRLIIEDIAGISWYEEKKQKALGELEKVEKKVSEVEIILHERKQYLEQLKEEKEQALRFRDLEQKLKQNKATLLHREIQGKQKEHDHTAEKIRQEKQKIVALQDEVNAIKTTITQKKQEIQAINHEIEQRGEKEQVLLHKMVESLRVEIATKEAKKESLVKEGEKSLQRQQQLEQSKKELEQKIAALTKEIEASLALQKEKEKQLKETEKKIESLKEKFNLSSMADIEKEADAIDKEIEGLQASIETLREEQQQAMREKDRLELQIKTIDERIAKLEAIEQENKKELAELKKKRDLFKKITLELNKVLQDDSAAAAQLKASRQKLMALQDHITELRAKTAVLSEKAMGDLAIQKILENKKTLGGVHGAVYELGHVKTKYSLALEVAAGPRIKSIVVDDEKVAAAAIELLRKNKWGIATFLPLTKIKPPEKMQVDTFLSVQGVHGKAVDLIAFDKKYKRVFEYVFGDTLVVDNLEVVKRIGVGTVRMVTLAGDLSELSGAMIGGYRQQGKSFSFKEKEVTEALEQAEEALEQEQKNLQQLEKKRADYEAAIEKLRAQKAELEGEIIKMEKALHLEPQELDLSTSMKEQYQDQLRRADKKLMELQLAISGVNSKLLQLKQKRQAVKDKVAALRDPAKLAELNAFEQRRKELYESLLKLEHETRNQEMQLETILKKEKENIDKVMKQTSKEQESFKSEITALDKEIAQKKKELAEKEEKEKSFYEQFKALFKKRNALSDELQSLEIKVISNEEKMRDLEQKTNMLELALTKTQTELTLLQQEYKQYEGIPLSEKADSTLKREIAEFEKMVADIGSVNLKAIELYQDLEREYTLLVQKKEKLQEERTDVLSLMQEIETKKKDAFLQTFTVINEHFKKMFENLSYKGQAYLELENPDDPLSAGLGIKVKIGTAKFLDLLSLSGGE
ncbi:MAG: chromosome segregation SMC family protein, partial [Candidatus Woesearchaeota archaeon]